MKRKSKKWHKQDHTLFLSLFRRKWKTVMSSWSSSVRKEERKCCDRNSGVEYLVYSEPERMRWQGKELGPYTGPEWIWNGGKNPRSQDLGWSRAWPQQKTLMKNTLKWEQFRLDLMFEYEWFGSLYTGLQMYTNYSFCFPESKSPSLCTAYSRKKRDAIDEVSFFEHASHY